MKKTWFLACVLPLLWSNFASAKIIVGASLPDLASIAASIGGDRVEVFTIARGNSDPHTVEVLPAYMVRVSRADVYLKVGLSLDLWADRILDGARNSKIQVVDCSQGVTVLEKPTTKVDASMGDVHPEGNPHYWLDPRNAIPIAQNVYRALVIADPDGQETYDVSLAQFIAEVQQRYSDMKNEAASLPNRTIVTYHASWPYFASAFGFTIAEKIEPVPGIPPAAKHLVHLVDVIRSAGVTTVISEPYFSDDGANYLARETGVKVLKLSPSCGDVSAGAYLRHIQDVLDALKAVHP